MVEPLKPEHKTATLAELDSLYSQNGFEAILPTSTREKICDRWNTQDTGRRTSDTEHTLGLRYIDPQTKHTVAVIYIYTDLFGNKKRVIYMLRIGDIIYDAKIPHQ